MKNEELLIDTQPSGVVLIPHLCLIFLFIGLITIWKPLFAKMSTHLKVTTKRVAAKKGIIKVESLDSPLDKITSVKTSQGLMGKIFNYGTIYINTPSGEFCFDYIPDVDKVKDAIIQNS